MSRESSTDGGLIVDKPSGATSHDVVAIARRALRERRIGHTGTLDPLATGVLVLLVGRATRLSQFLVSDEKEYIADVRLGVSTPTYDADVRVEGDFRPKGGFRPEGAFRLKAEATEGAGSSVRLQPDDRQQADDRAADFRLKAEATEGAAGSFRLQPEDLERVLSRFRGTFLQTPPPHSAKKIGGVRAYERARKNEPMALAPVEVTVRELEIVAPDAATTADFPRPSPLAPRFPLLRLRIVCSSGFYVRSLAHDLGQALGCGAHLEALRRTRAGRFSIGEAIPIEVLATDPDAARRAVRPMNALLADYAAVTLSADGARRAAHGNLVRPEHLAEPAGRAIEARRVRLLDASGALLAIAERRPDLALQPLVVLV